MPRQLGNEEKWNQILSVISLEVICKTHMHGGMLINQVDHSIYEVKTLKWWFQQSYGAIESLEFMAHQVKKNLRKYPILFEHWEEVKGYGLVIRTRWNIYMYTYIYQNSSCQSKMIIQRNISTWKKQRAPQRINMWISLHAKVYTHAHIHLYTYIYMHMHRCTHLNYIKTVAWKRKRGMEVRVKYCLSLDYPKNGKNINLS
jgi:hypothetical protein